MRINGSIEYKCERICQMYIDTGRTCESLAKYYNCGHATIGRYIKDYAQKYLPYNKYRQVRKRALQNKQEVIYYGRSLAYNSNELGRYE